MLEGCFLQERNKARKRTKESHVTGCFSVGLKLILRQVGRLHREWLRIAQVPQTLLKGHSHAILVHFKNQKYVLTSMNALK